MAILYDSTNMSRIVTILWDNLIQLTCLDLSKAIRWWNTLKFGVPKFEQMADEMLSETKWFLGSLRASRAIKKILLLFFSCHRVYDRFLAKLHSGGGREPNFESFIHNFCLKPLKWRHKLPTKTLLFDLETSKSKNTTNGLL